MTTRQDEAERRIREAVARYGDGLVMTSSFGIQAAVLLHMATRIKPDIPVIFIDTQYLFPETYAFKDELAKRLNLNLHTYRAKTDAAAQEAKHGKRWEQGLAGFEAYNLENKVEPLDRAIRELGAVAWLSGLRGEQSSTRKDKAETEQQGEIAKIYPLIDWTAKDIYEYLKKHDLPYHPLWEQGYVSVGDTHSTRKWEPGMAEEDTRGNGIKRECGLHDPSNRPPDFRI